GDRLYGRLRLRPPAWLRQRADDGLGLLAPTRSDPGLDGGDRRGRPPLGGVALRSRRRHPGLGGRPPGAERHRQLRGAAAAPPSYARLYRRFPLLQSASPAVPRDPAVAIIGIFGPSRVAHPLRARRSDDRRGPPPVYRSPCGPVANPAPVK